MAPSLKAAYIPSEGELKLLRLSLHRHLLETLLVINITEWKAVGCQCM